MVVGAKLAGLGQRIDTPDVAFDHSFKPVTGATEFLCGSIDSVTGSWTKSTLFEQLLGGLPTGGGERVGALLAATSGAGEDKPDLGLSGIGVSPCPQPVHSLPGGGIAGVPR